jgi:hypothetical protein
MFVNATAFGKKASTYVAHANAVTYTRVEHLKGASLRQALALPENIRLGWKSLPGTNFLAYYQNS